MGGFSRLFKGRQRSIVTVPSKAPAPVGPAPAPRPPAPTPRPQSSHPYAREIDAAARRFGIPREWIIAVMRTESANNPNAVSHAGAGGLMQIMPGTWEYLTGRHGLGSDRFDPAANVMSGAAYLREMYDRSGSMRGMLASYNAGPGRWDDHVRRGRPLPTETVNYIAAILPRIEGYPMGRR